MAVVAFDAVGTEITGAAATSFSDTTLTIGANANALLVPIVWSTSAAPTSVSITWNGVALTLIPGTSTNNGTAGNVAIYGLINPATGNHTLAGSWTGARDFYTIGESWSGVDTSSFNAAFGSATTTTGTSTTPSISIGSPASGGSLAVFATQGTFTAFTTGTQDFLDNTQTNVHGAAGHLVNVLNGAPALGISVSSAFAAGGIALFPGPLFAYPDFGRSFAPIRGQSPQFPNLAINLPQVTNAFARPPLFNKPFDIPGIVWQPLGSTLTLTANLGPWTQTDFSKPSAYLSNKPIDGAGTNINLYPNPIPFGPFDWNKPALPYRPQPRVEGTNINLFTNPIPFGPYDWNKPALPYLPQPRVEGVNINLFTNPIPFGPYDWSRPALFQPAPPPASQASPLVQFANLGPFTQPQPPPVWRCPAAPAIALPSNIALLTATAATAPVIPYDFSKPFFPSVATDKTQPTNINLFTNPIPFYPVDLSKPFFPRNVPAVTLPVNPNLYVPSATAVPFAQTDWSKSYFNPAIPAEQHLLVFFPAPPVIPVDTSYTTQPAPSRPHPYAVSIALTAAPAATPFAQTDWPRAYVNPAISAEIYSLLFFPPAPIIPTDTSYVTRPVPSAPHPYTTNIALTSVVVPAPFVPIDWSKPFFPHATSVDPASGSTNPKLFTNPIPFFNSMDFRSPARPQWRTWDQGPPNMALLTTPPPPPPVSTEQPPYFFNLSFGKLSGF